MLIWLSIRIVLCGLFWGLLYVLFWFAPEYLRRRRKRRVDAVGGQGCDCGQSARRVDMPKL